MGLWVLSQATAPAARSAPVVPSMIFCASGTAADDPQRRKPRGGGDRLPVVDPQGRRRVDPQGVRDRHAGADRRRVPRAVGLHCQGAVPSLSLNGCTLPRGGPPLAGGHLSGDRRRGPPVRMRRSTGATRPRGRPTSNRDGVTPARGGRRGSRCPIPHIRMNLISTHEKRGIGPLHDLQRDDDGRTVYYVPGANAQRDDPKRSSEIVDRLRAHEAKKRWRALGRGACGSDRVILPATVRPRAECGRRTGTTT